MTDPADMGVDIIYGGVDEPQPNWRTDEDSDDQIDDDDDPEPIDKQILIDTLGFDPDEEVYGSESDDE